MRKGPRRVGARAEESAGAMQPFAILSTRIPKVLRERMKFFCFEQELRLQDFVTAALEGRLRRRKPGRRTVVR